ncbi:MAG TPA: BTAD domain-containing putative transcriptional regulator, partial [Longimicrobiales bacterium]|nr:BTAD domain-containing putative transcriptional regulator [Longimicrobiales bacterium]
MLIRLLGPPRIEGPNGAVTGPASQRHRLALLALLAHSPHHVSARERLIGLLWPEAEASTARQLLSVTVYELRKALGDAVLLSEGPTLRLDPNQIDIDSLAFERTRAAGDAESATALYTGPFLDGFALPDALEFERWVESERDRIEREYQGALEQLAERATAQGDRSQAVHWWRQRLACTPTEGRVVRRLMEALERAGDRAGALQVADVHNATLLREFGADPDAEVTALADRLRRTVRVTPPLPANRLDGGAREPHAKPAAVFLTGQRIAVLPFTAIPSDLEGNALALGLTDDLIAGLSQVDGLAIICRTTIMQYRGATRSVRQIGAELGVGIVVEGAVHANGERVHVNARLVDTASDQLLWSS